MQRLPTQVAGRAGLPDDGLPIISVFGANDPLPDSEEYEFARAVGGVLAGLGYAVANGGYGGTMEASARGAKEAGGSTVGVTCSIWKTQANRFMDRCVRTIGLDERIERLTELGNAGYVVLPGATGTLLELASVWERMCKKMMPRRPLVCVAPFWRPLVEMMAAARSGCQECLTLIERPGQLRERLPKASSWVQPAAK